MPVTVQGPDGATYQFPDGTDKSAAIAYFKKKGINAKPSSDALTANPKNEGLYSVTKNGQAIKVPFSQIQSAATQGYELSPEDVSRYAKDASFASMDQTPSLRDQLTAVELHKTPHSAKELAHEVGVGFGNIGAGGMNVVLRPVDTLKGFGTLIRHPLKTATEISDQAAEHPLESAEGFLGQMAALGGGDIAREKMTPAVTDFAKGKIAKLTKTTPEHVGTFVAKTAEDNAAKTAKADEANAAAKAKADEANAKAAADRKVDLRKHFEKTRDIKAAQETAETAASRKAAAARGVEQIDEPLREDLTKTRETVRGEADARYNTQRAELNKKQIPFDPKASENPDQVTSENFVGKVSDAWDSAITGSETRPPIIKSIEDRVNSSEPLTWKDLQGYRSEIGKKISSGNLPGDEFYGYKKVLGVIDDGMQKIADANGMGKQVAADRAFYRQYMETFHDPSSPVYKAINATERGGTLKALRTTDRSGIEAVAKYNPELAKRLNSGREALETSRKSVPKGTLKSLPKLAPKPEPVSPNITKPNLKVVTPETLHQFKADQVLGKGENLENTSNRMATIFTGLDAIRNIFRRNPEGIAIDLAARGSFGAIQNAVGKLLENPKIVNTLTNLTPADVEQAMRLPADQRAGFDQLVKQAQKQGITIPPAALAALAAVTPRKKPVAAALSQ